MKSIVFILSYNFYNSARQSISASIFLLFSIFIICINLFFIFTLVIPFWCQLLSLFLFPVFSSKSCAWRKLRMISFLYISSSFHLYLSIYLSFTFTLVIRFWSQLLSHFLFQAFNSKFCTWRKTRLTFYYFQGDYLIYSVCEWYLFLLKSTIFFFFFSLFCIYTRLSTSVNNFCLTFMSVFCI